MASHKVQATITDERTIIVRDLPFGPGDRVEVTVRPKRGRRAKKDAFPLKGSVLRYDDPFEPVALDEWEALA